MGQTASSPTPLNGPSSSLGDERQSSFWRRSTTGPGGSSSSSSSTLALGSGAATAARSPRPHTRSSSMNRLSRIMSSSSPVAADDTNARLPRRPSRLQRARTSFTSLVPHVSSRRERERERERLATSRRGPLSRSLSGNTHGAERPAAANPPLYTLPDVQVPELDLDFSTISSSASAGPLLTPRPSSRRSSLRLPNSLTERLNALRSTRNAAGGNAALRRRRSPLRHGEDNTALLSRLLSVAAAATAATLLEGNEHAMSEARSTAGDGDDGTFDGFLQSLEDGRLTSALSQGGQIQGEDASGTGIGHAPLNFFRMFRFGSPTSTASASTSASASASASASRGTGETSTPLQDSDSQGSRRSGEASMGGRMVPIIIVGIRAVMPGSRTQLGDDGIPPFLDALSTLPTTAFGGHPAGHDTIDNILRSPQNASTFSHRRRASMSGLANFPSAYDAQRHHHSPDHSRPSSVTPDGASWPRPPPVTPASSNLSAVTSRNSTPAQTRPASSGSTPATPPRRESIIRTTTTTTLETTSEDAPLRPRTARQRRLSESDYTRTAYASRRNGIVEPDHAPAENTRSWIIYVLGGSYPENHPILTTPSLFTDSPTYEDMMLLSALLGPAKPPVASENDVADAPGLFHIGTVSSKDEASGGLFAVSADGNERIPLAPEQRCLVCLCDFEKQEEARRLVKCHHLFHRECIDEWLTKGRNSCPLCRGQGVDEKKSQDSSAAASGPPSPAPGAASALAA